MAPHTESREAPPVYRCSDHHWHFIPHRDDYDLLTSPWYRWKVVSGLFLLLPTTTHQLPKQAHQHHTNKFPQQPQEEQTLFPSGTQVYVKGGGDGPFIVKRKMLSGFYALQTRLPDNRTATHCCMGRYNVEDYRLWREEELSRAPWGRKKEEMPPAYEASSSSSSGPPGYYLARS